MLLILENIVKKKMLLFIVVLYFGIQFLPIFSYAETAGCQLIFGQGKPSEESKKAYLKEHDKYLKTAIAY